MEAQQPQHTDMTTEFSSAEGFLATAVDKESNLHTDNSKKEETIKIVYENVEDIVFIELPEGNVHKAMWHSDLCNLRLDRYNNRTAVRISNREKAFKGKQLKRKESSNITFGAENGQTCFVPMTNGGCFETFPCANSGPFIIEYTNLINI